MTAEYPQGDEPLIPMPALSLQGLRTVQRGPLMLVYLTDVRAERVVII
jgi:hypothetical protein